MRFALLADCHIGEERPYEGVVRKLSRYALPFIDEIIDELGDSVDFIVQLGDLIEDGDDVQGDIDNYRAGIAAFARAPVPVLHVFGNHEQVHLTVPQLCAIAGQIDGGATAATSASGDAKAATSGLADAAETPELAATFELAAVPELAATLELAAIPELAATPVLAGLTDAPYYSCNIAGYRLIVLFSSSVKHTDIHVDRAQIEWLKKTLSQGSEPVLVFVHHPLDEQSLIGNVWFEKYPDYCFCEERLELRQVLEASKRVLAVFGGHVHQNSVSCINGIYYVTVQSLVERIERDGGRDAKDAERDTKEAERDTKDAERDAKEAERDAKEAERDTKDAEPSRAYALVDVLKNEAGDHQLKIDVRGNDALAVDVKC